ncbi:ubiquitin-like modifier-activating enzyme 6 isoform X2 [Hydractinia symbiolongicarpus]|uniref:ubiquitin-like modifier-activating enzyme 6 isoform X2 n=1 Tax=Hydractinia symbiolongicarpus TaxID=13093 RepID=UPI00254B7B56|nr:ubiquitin-like modifier-activating enzyme 6 isoform X2 [Hydractinia symbiolongicarpus]
MTEENIEIDDSLYSRQRYVLGDGAMQELAKAHVLIVGLGGVGVEVAKNVILAGVKSVSLFDNNAVKLEDLGTQFFLRQEDISNNLTRAVACCKRLHELNPYVNIDVVESLDNIEILTKYQCVVVTEMLFEDQVKMNAFCRTQNPPIRYISCDVYGVFSYLFCDFGDKFQVFDSDGEESKEIFMKSITKENPAVVETLDYRRHGLETDDSVTFREINGMTSLNFKTFRVKYINPYSFSINCDTTKLNDYLHGGVFVKTKVTKTVNFSSLASQLTSPDILLNDLSKLETPVQLLIGLISINKFASQNGSSFKDISVKVDEVLKLAEDSNALMESKQNKIDSELVLSLIRTCEGKLPPLCASIGGIAAQEVLKAVSGKFSPLKQWVLLDAMEVANDADVTIKTSRYFSLNKCLKSSLIEKLKCLKLFMVGCGAIGCEMLKNYALLGVSIDPDGLITITDNDLIEKSNLNRQFLFRPWHIQATKSVTAAEATKEINPDLHILAHQNKVSSATQEEVYNDAFFEKQDIIVNALDNIEARRYVDGRCVANKRSLLETGTMGPKGHVQVIVPYVTESYSNQRDPADEDVPYCTLKSFPQVIEHTIQWARDKFESLFTLKPSSFNKFWENYPDPQQLVQNLSDSSQAPDGFGDAARLLQKKPSDWTSCLVLGREKFERYFNHKALQLLHMFPLDTKLSDGSWFWQSPKRPPTPIDFSEKNLTHLQFVISYAKLVARVNDVEVKPEDLHEDYILRIINAVKVPEFIASNKKIEVEEGDKPEKQQKIDEDKISLLISYLRDNNVATPSKLSIEHFEKDDDANSHIDFITAASNLRAVMYNIEPADRYKTKRIAGKIIPAIATTTAAIAGLASIELLKVVDQQPLENLKNCFLNLALPMMVLSEPGAAPKTRITNDIEFTSWDHWEVHGHKEYKLKDFIRHFKDKYKLNISMVCQGVKMIYVPVMPGHKKRVNDTMLKLLKPGKDEMYTDLVIAFEAEVVTDEYDDDLPAPPVRYFYQST